MDGQPKTTIGSILFTFGDERHVPLTISNGNKISTFIC